MMMGESSLSGMGATIASFIFLWSMIRQYLPYRLDGYVEKYSTRLFLMVYPYIEITVHEYSGEYFKRSEAYTTIQSYLSASSSERAKKLKADVGKDSSNLVVSMDDNEQVTDEFHGAKLWWSSDKKVNRSTSLSIYPASDERRYYKLTFHRSHRQLVMDQYLSHVMKEGKAIGVRNRQRKLYTNNPSQNWYGYKKTVWSHVVFEHPATFETVAMDPDKKQEIIDDLQTFKESKDYYKKIGKAWKRGYLLYGPPGTGKSTMVAAMANLMDYDIYDLELTSVKNNTELRKLFIETSGKSIIVIEDIDCSLDLSGKRKKKEKPKDDEEEEKKFPPGQDDKDEPSKVTLSGLLNFIDGLWSSCGGERLIVFTTNHVEKLDPALIRRGRMDKYIELSFCRFGGFKVLAKNYLNINSHPLFDEIRRMMQDTNITPADVAENLMLKSSSRLNDKGRAEVCLKDLIQSLHKAKEDAIKVELESKAANHSSANGNIETAAVANGDTVGEGKSGHNNSK